MSISHALDSDHEINNEEGNDVFITDSDNYIGFIEEFEAQELLISILSLRDYQDLFNNSITNDTRKKLFTLFRNDILKKNQFKNMDLITTLLNKLMTTGKGQQKYEKIILISVFETVISITEEISGISHWHSLNTEQARTSYNKLRRVNAMQGIEDIKSTLSKENLLKLYNYFKKVEQSQIENANYNYNQEINNAPFVAQVIIYRKLIRDATKNSLLYYVGEGNDDIIIGPTGTSQEVFRSGKITQKLQTLGTYKNIEIKFSSELKHFKKKFKLQTTGKIDELKKLFQIEAIRNPAHYWHILWLLIF